MNVRLTWKLAALYALIPACADAGESNASKISREAEFRLTYANDDLTWLGDPASPTALVYPKPSARPLATDFCVTTLIEAENATARRYLREARITADREVRAFTTARELAIGRVDDSGKFEPNATYAQRKELLPSWPADPSSLRYDAQENALYQESESAGPVLTESLDFLPLSIELPSGSPVEGDYAIESRGSEVVLVLRKGEESAPIAAATIPRVLRRSEVELGSFDNSAGTYLREAAYRPGAAVSAVTKPAVTFVVEGTFRENVIADGESLVLNEAPAKVEAQNAHPKIAIDGSFEDWRNIAGIDDPRGDLVPYLEYIPDVDLLEFKVAHDEEHLYLYARVAGQVGKSHPAGGRSYFYAYIDVDQNPETGFLPTRDDDCYFGVDIGDDCEVQFEFVDNSLRKTFYGFCGKGGDDNVLKQVVTLGRSQYGRLDERGNERADYKSEYTYRGGKTEITEDLKLGTSDTIRLAVSPDGREVEIVSDLSGFLKNSAGKPTLAPGQSIDLAAGMECDSKAYVGKSRWAADSTPAIRNYRLAPAVEPSQP